MKDEGERRGAGFLMLPGISNDFKKRYRRHKKNKTYEQ